MTSSKKNRRSHIVAAPTTSDWPMPTAAISALSVAWTVIVLFFYFQQTPIDWNALTNALDQVFVIHWFNLYLLHAMGSLAIMLFVEAVALDTGHRLIRYWIRMDDLSVYEDAALSLGIGLALMSHLVFLLGVCRLWYPSVFWGLLTGAALYGIIRRSTSFFSTTRSFAIDSGPGSKIAAIFLFFFFFTFLIGEFTPEIFYDALFYHLAIPNLYRVGHRLVDFPTSLFSNYVLTIQRLYGLAITLWDETTAKLFHGLMAAGLVCALIGSSQRFLSKGTGTLAALLFFSMPLVGINVITTGIDIGWSFYQGLAGYALLRTLTQRDPTWTRLAGLFAGLAASCKYPGFSYLPIGFFILFWKRKSVDALTWPETFRELAEFTGFATLALAPIFARNLVFHGNPVYPFGALHWGTPRIDPHYWSIFRSEAGIPDLRGEFGSWMSSVRYLLHPWFQTMEGHDNGTFVGPLYLIVLPFVFLIRAPSTGFLWLRRYCGLLWLVWMVTSTTPRYGLAALALAALLMAETLSRQCRPSSVRPVLLILVVSALVNNFSQFTGILYAMEGWKVVGGLVSKSDYLKDMHASYPTPPFEAIEWMNENLPEGSKILFAGESRSYYSRWPVIPFSVHDPEPLMRWSHEATSGDALAQHLRDQQITHLFLNYAEAIRTENYGAFHWDAAQWAVFNQFWSHNVVLIWKKEEPRTKALYVFKLLSAQEAQEPHPVPENPFARWAVHSS